MKSPLTPLLTLLGHVIYSMLYTTSLYRICFRYLVVDGNALGHGSRFDLQRCIMASPR